MTPISFTVLGLAAPAGSKTAYAPKHRDGSPVLRPNGSVMVTVADANKKAALWKREVAEAARQAYDGELLDYPLSLSLTFYRPRPKSHFGARGVRPSATLWPTTKPDVLKLARAVEDALTGIIWRDDAQIVHEVLVKHWGEPARVCVLIAHATAVQQGIVYMETDCD